MGSPKKEKARGNGYISPSEFIHSQSKFDCYSMVKEIQAMCNHSDRNALQIGAQMSVNKEWYFWVFAYLNK
jgi:hypothetical protein